MVLNVTGKESVSRDQMLEDSKMENRSKNVHPMRPTSHDLIAPMSHPLGFHHLTRECCR